MKETWQQYRQRSEECRNVQAANGRDRDKLAILRERKVMLRNEIQELKGQLALATSKLETAVGIGRDVGIKFWICTGVTRRPVLCAPGAVRSLFMKGWQNQSEIAHLRSTLAIKQTEYDSLKSQIEYQDRLSEASSNKFKQNDCYGLGLWLNR